jgi:medium-chain acyl-[acyl-carrier-protein] hydrolase
MKPTSLSTWIFRPRPLSAPRVRLFCFPHGGGNASSFREWAAQLPENVELCAIQLPGRGARMTEAPAKSVAQIVLGLAEAFHPYREIPVALFGHSLGAIISFEFARQLRSMNIRPVHLFVSGCVAAHLPDPEAPISHLNAREFIDSVSKRYHNIPDEILHEPEMMNLWLPALRADFTIRETYRYVDGPLLDCPISAFGGQQDGSVTVEELAAWRDLACGAFSLRIFPGDHFFIDSARESLLKLVAADLERSLRETFVGGSGDMARESQRTQPLV